MTDAVVVELDAQSRGIGEADAVADDRNGLPDHVLRDDSCHPHGEGSVEDRSRPCGRKVRNGRGGDAGRGMIARAELQPRGGGDGP